MANENFKNHELRSEITMLAVASERPIFPIVERTLIKHEVARVVAANGPVDEVVRSIGDESRRIIKSEFRLNRLFVRVFKALHFLALLLALPAPLFLILSGASLLVLAGEAYAAFTIATLPAFAGLIATIVSTSGLWAVTAGLFVTVYGLAWTLSRLFKMMSNRERSESMTRHYKPERSQTSTL